jgi:hypothetical protein
MLPYIAAPWILWVIDYFPSYKTAFGNRGFPMVMATFGISGICQAASKEAARPLLQDMTGAKFPVHGSESCDFPIWKDEHPELEAFSDSNHHRLLITKLMVSQKKDDPQVTIVLSMCFNTKSWYDWMMTG